MRNYKCLHKQSWSSGVNKISGHVVTASSYYHGDVVEDAGGLLTAAAVK